MEGILGEKTASSRLKEFAEQRGLKAEFELLGRDGASHAPTFIYRAWVDDKVNVTGKGPSKIKAKHDAAQKAFAILSSLEAKQTKATDSSAQSPRNENYVGKLQEYAQKNGITALPHYECSKEEGPAHAKQFTFTVSFEGLSSTGTNKDKKAAKQSAAEELLKKLPETQPQAMNEGGGESKVTSPSKAVTESFVSRFEQEYEFKEVLGHGAFGVVFKAQNLNDEEDYAVKRVKLPNDNENREKVLREVKALAKLDNPHIVRYFSNWIEHHPSGWQMKNDEQYNLSNSEWPDDDSIVFESSHGTSNNATKSLKSTESTKTSSEAQAHYYMEISDEMIPASQDDGEAFLFIQMKLCNGSLQDWLEKNREDRDLMKVKKIFKQIVMSLEYLHRKELMHRDLKPSNIFLSESDSVKIGDFGLAKKIVWEEQQASAGSQSTSGARHTKYKGTPLYMSPEQAENINYDNKTDIFSLGLIFLELLIPCTSFHERQKTIGNARTQQLPNELVSRWPEEHDLIKQMTSKDPNHRPSAKDILKEILYEEYLLSTF